MCNNFFQVVKEDVAKFDTYSNNMWAVRHRALFRFQQAAGKHIIRARADKRIKALKLLKRLLREEETPQRAGELNQCICSIPAHPVRFFCIEHVLLTNLNQRVCRQATEF